MALTPVVAWDGPGTCFQLEGQPPTGRRPADGPLWDCAANHLGHYGTLRAANTHLLRRAGTGPMDLSDRPWRGSHDGRVHPDEAADKAIADGAANMGCEL